MSLTNAYLDYNATTPLKPAVMQAMVDAMRYPYNASSVHSFGRRAKLLVEEARKQLRQTLGAEDRQVIFTSSGTEANNLALRGLKGYSLAVSAVEHACVLKTAKAIGNEVIIPVDHNGIINLGALDHILQTLEGKILVSVMLANNETGVIQPIQEIVTIARKYKALVHTDAAQAVGKIPVDMAALGVDMMTVSAHKFGGPQGAAALIIKKDIHLAAQITGGGQERGYRAGTENIPAIVGFGVAAGLVQESLAEAATIEQLRDSIEAQLPEAFIAGKKVARLPNTSCLMMPKMKSETQLIHFDLEGIALSAGAACSSGKVETSHVLLAMGINPTEAATAVRISLGIETKKSEADAFITAWQTLYKRVRDEHKAAA